MSPRTDGMHARPSAQVPFGAHGSGEHGCPGGTGVTHWRTHEMTCPGGHEKPHSGPGCGGPGGGGVGLHVTPKLPAASMTTNTRRIDRR
jgi:hypothetical protein